MAQAVQEATGHDVQLAYVDQAYGGDPAVQAALAHGIELQETKLPEAKRGFVLLSRPWVVGRSFDWASRFRRLPKDYEWLPQTVAGFQFLSFAILMLAQLCHLF